VWAPDGSSIAFVSDRDGGVLNIYRKNSTGSGDDVLLLKTARNKRLDDWSRDGRHLLFEQQSERGDYDLWALPLDGTATPFPVLQTPCDERRAAFSPGGRWFAYESNEGGRSDAVTGTPSSWTEPVDCSPLT
jgi:Tol biopolymer transport system component